MNIGEKIKNARLAKGYTQEELGKMIGVQKSAVAKYEKGRVVNIKRSVLAKIAQVLEIPPIELVSDIEEKPVELGTLYGKVIKDVELQSVLEEYFKLSDNNKKEARKYIHYLYATGGH